MHREVLQAGVVPALVDAALADWPAGGDLARSTAPNDAVVKCAGGTQHTLRRWAWVGGCSQQRWSRLLQ